MLSVGATRPFSLIVCCSNLDGCGTNLDGCGTVHQMHDDETTTDYRPTDDVITSTNKQEITINITIHKNK